MTQWRRQDGALGTRERLADISRYFLSDPEASDAKTSVQPPETWLLPILVGPELTQALVYALARALHTRSITAIVLHIEPRLRSTDPRSTSLCSDPDTPQALRMRLQDGLGSTKPQPHVCLIPVSESRDMHLRDYERALIVLGATPAALKQSYLSIKQLALAGIETRIGTIVVGAKDNSDGRKLFDRLAAAAMRFLGRTLDYVGTVMAPAPESGSRDSAGATPGPLNEIVESLLRDGFLGKLPGHPARGCGSLKES